MAESSKQAEETTVPKRLAGRNQPGPSMVRSYFFQALSPLQLLIFPCLSLWWSHQGKNHSDKSRNQRLIIKPSPQGTVKRGLSNKEKSSLMANLISKAPRPKRYLGPGVAPFRHLHVKSMWTNSSVSKDRSEGVVKNSLPTHSSCCHNSVSCGCRTVTNQGSWTP